MAYAHALVLNEDKTTTAIRIACNADAQHWTIGSGLFARQCREELFVQPDGIVRFMIEDEDDT